MNKLLMTGLLGLAMLGAPLGASAQFSLDRIVSGVSKAIQAGSLTDDDIIAYVHQSVEYMDKKNQVCGHNDPYTKRLERITSGITEVNGLPLNFKVYKTNDVNAFACADGSIRVYSHLMDIMTDDEVLGVIGHEIGHVVHKDTKKQIKNALLTSALKDGLGATSAKVAALTDSQLGALGETLINANYSKKQESNADDYGYEFLKEHGKNPLAMASAFEKLKTLEGGAAVNGVNQLFSDHPDLDSRINHMEEMAARDGYTMSTPDSAVTPTTTKKSTKKSTAVKRQTNSADVITPDGKHHAPKATTSAEWTF